MVLFLPKNTCHHMCSRTFYVLNSNTVTPQTESEFHEKNVSFNLKCIFGAEYHVLLRLIQSEWNIVFCFTDYV